MTSSGVGIIFNQHTEQNGFIAVTIKSLIPGSPAERSGLLKPGDLVVRVDDTDVIGQPLQQLRQIIPGPRGSSCKLGFLRGSIINGVEGAGGQYFSVELIRGGLSLFEGTHVEVGGESHPPDRKELSALSPLTSVASTPVSAPNRPTHHAGEFNTPPVVSSQV